LAQAIFAQAVRVHELKKVSDDDWHA